MDEKQKYWRLGLFVLSTLVVTLVLLLMLGLGSLFRKSFVFETYFDDSISGLAVGSPVEFRGIPLGEVTEIFSTFAAYESDVPIDKRHSYIVVRAEVSSHFEKQTMQMKEDIPEYVKRGLRARTQLLGITGQQFLSLDLVDPKGHRTLEFDWEPEYVYIPSAPSQTGEIIDNVQQFLATLNQARVQELINDFDALVTNINSAVEQLPIQDIGTEIHSLLVEFNSIAERVGEALDEAPLNETFSNVHSATARLDALLAQPALEQTVNNAGAVTDVLRRAAENGELDRIIQNIDQSVQRLDSILADNQYDVRVLVQDLRATASNLRTLSDNAKRYPAGALIGGPPKKVEIPEE